MICGNSAALAAYEREESEYHERFSQALDQAQDELGPKFGKFDELVLQLKGLEDSFSKLASYSGPSERLGDLCAGVGGGLSDVLHDLGQELPGGSTLKDQLDSLWESECERYAEKLIENGDF